MNLFNLPYDNTGVTVELGTLIESGIDIWDFEYPSYYEGEEKKAFENKVTQHFYFRQIGQETPARWLHYFHNRMREIMPYYIQLYHTQEIMAALENPFDNVDVTETFTQDTTDNSTTTSTGNSSTTTNGTISKTSEAERSETSTGTHGTDTSGTNIDTRNVTNDLTRKFSNTPQGSISNLDNYLTEATTESTDNTDTLNSSQTSETSETMSNTASGTDNLTETASDTSNTAVEDETNITGSATGKVTSTLHRKGNHGVNTYAHDMNEYRTTLLNIDKMIINELNDLFLLVY